MKEKLYGFLVITILMPALIVGLSVLLRLGPLDVLGDRLPYAILQPAVVLVAIFGGFYSGLVATLFSVLFVYFGGTLGFNFIKDSADLLGLLIFIVNGVIFSIIGEISKRIRMHMRDALAHSQRLQEALDRIPIYVYFKDKNHRYFYANQSTLELFNCSAEELRGKDDRSFFPPETVEKLNEVDIRVLEHGESTDEEIVSHRRDGTPLYYLEAKTPIYNAGEITGLCGISMDITIQKKTEEALRESEERFRMTFDYAPIGISIVDTNGYFVQPNKALCQMLGYTYEELQQKRFQDITHPDDTNGDAALLEQVVSGSITNYKREKRYLCKDGRVIWISLSGSVVHNDNNKIKYLITQIVDITEHKLLIDQLEKQAHWDYLTGLYNRRFLLEQGDLELSRAHRFNLPFSLLMLDIDHFKKINDTYGHLAGDLVLQSISRLLINTLRKIDIIGRVGGEEFAIILPHTDAQGALEIAERIRMNIASSSTSADNNELIYYTISIGVVTKDTQKATTLDKLLHFADTALYRAKKEGRNRVCVSQTPRHPV